MTHWQDANGTSWILASVSAPFSTEAKFATNNGAASHGSIVIRRCLEKWNEGDNGILEHARAYRLVVGEGWQINPGILHAPGSLVTYEPR